MLAFGFTPGYEGDVKPKEGCENHGQQCVTSQI